MWKVAFLLSLIAFANLGRAVDDQILSSSHKPYTGMTAGENRIDPSTVKPPEFSTHRVISALHFPPLVFNRQPFVMNPKSQDLQASSSTDYVYAHAGGSNGYEYHVPSYVYDHHLQPGSEPTYHAEEDSHHLEHRQVGTSARDIALGFLTFLIILSTLQGATLNLMRNPNIVSIMPAGRRRRDVEQQLAINEVPEMTSFTKITEERTSLMDDNPVRHAQQNICVTASNIAKFFGLSGSTFAHYIRELISKSDSNGWTRLVADAGSAGLRGVQCEYLYRHNAIMQ